MRRLWILAAAAILILPLAGCGKNKTPEQTTPASEAATDAPYLDTQLDEPEWTLAEGELSLEDADNIYAEGEDILYFAIVTADDGTQELRFRMNDETATMLKAQSPDNAYYMTLDGKKIGSATLSADCRDAIVTQDDASEEITTLASKIRGLSE